MWLVAAYSGSAVGHRRSLFKPGKGCQPDIIHLQNDSECPPYQTRVLLGCSRIAASIHDAGIRVICVKSANSTIRCWERADARTARPTRLPHDLLEHIAERITDGVSGIVSVTYGIATKPPSTMEVV